MNHPRALPIGSRRLHDVGNGFVYWLIKVAPTGRWQYEHRVVAEQVIGRPLMRSEHVHHKNEDTLDNWPDNLVVLDHPAHIRGHLTISSWSKRHNACIECGQTTFRHIAKGLCSSCYQRRVYDRKRVHPR